MDYCGPCYNPAEIIQENNMYPSVSIFKPSELLQVEEKSNGEHKTKFVKQQNGGYRMELSKFKTIVLSMFNGNMYMHVWDNKNKKNVSLNMDELYQLSNKKTIEDTMDTMWADYGGKSENCDLLTNL